MARDILTPFADNGDKTNIPDGVQPSGSVSYEEGWGSQYEIDPAAGGRRLAKNNFNDLFNLLTTNQKELVDQGVINHIEDKEYLINAKVRGTDGNNYTSNKTTVTSPPSADWDVEGTIDSVVLQKVSFETGTYASGTTQIPLDDTIPQNTEGTQFMTLGITPINATSKLRITVTAVWANSSAGQMTLALFRDAVADSIGAVSEDSLANIMHTTTFSVTVDSNSISLTNFNFRFGLNGGSTNYFNGRNGSRTLGGVNASSIAIEEIL